MGASQSGVFNLQEFTNLGDLAAGFRLYTYEPSTTTLKIAYTDAAGTVPHTYTSDGQGGQYIALNARGELSAPLFLAAGGYDLTLRSSQGVMIWTRRANSIQDAVDELGTVIQAEIDTLLDRLDDVVDIRDYGGADDWNGSSGTNNFSAFVAIYAAFPNGCRIVLPKRGTGVYNVDGNQFYASLPHVFDPEPGVSLRVVGSFSPVNVAGLSSTRPLSARFATQQITGWYEPYLNRTPSEKLAFMSAADGEAHSASVVNQNIGIEGVAIAWPNGPVTAQAPTSSATDSNTWSPASGSGINLTTVPLRPGSEVSAYFRDNATGGFAYAGNLLAGVITDAGFAVVRQDVTGGGFILSVKSGAAALVETNLAAVPGNLSSYFFYRSLVAIRLHTPTSFAVLVNGIEVARCADAGGFILSAGFGPGFATNSNGLTVAGMAITRGHLTVGAQPLRIVTVGDSITAGDSWVTDLRRNLAGFAGAQVSSLLNVAVSGDTSTAQAAALSATNISGYRFCLIQIGVNDIQGGATAATLLGNVTTMVNYCRTNGVVPIVGIPTMFYGQAQAATAGNLGNATGNFDRGGEHRAALIRHLGSLGVAANLNTLSDYGAIVPSLIGVDTLDPVVGDNIHPTIFGKRVLGYCWAKAVIGQISPIADKSLVARAALAAWCSAGYGTTNLPVFEIAADILSWSGLLSTPTSAIPNGTTIMTLPRALRPRTDKHFIVPAATGAGSPTTAPAVALVVSASTGAVTIFGVTTGTNFLYCGGMSWPLAIA